MSDYKAKMPQTPLWELTALPQIPYLYLRGPTSKRREGKVGGEGERRERRREGESRGLEGPPFRAGTGPPKG